MRYSPGPWSVSATGLHVEDDRKITVASCWHGESPDVLLRPEAIRNARLIAAAPELLEALIAIYPFVEADDGNFDTEDPYQNGIDKVRNAIAKAEGGAE